MFKTKKIIFRADGNAEIGLGHLYRLFSLVEEIKSNVQFVFLTREDTITSVIPNSYNKQVISKTISLQDEPKWLAQNFVPQSHLIIADGYQFNSSYQKKIKQLGYNLIYVDDLAQEFMYADIVINHSPYINVADYKKHDDTYLALGTKYALLRPMFLKAAKVKRKISTINSAFICFGGADPFNLTLKAVEALLLVNSFKTINVVLGGAYKHLQIRDLERKFPTKINIFDNLPEKQLLSVMQKSNYAIVPASTILYELCCVKMPILSGFYVDNQELIYKGFLNNKAIFDAGDMHDFKIADFVTLTNKILTKKHYNDQIKAQEILFDENISSRHINLINQLLC